MVCPHGQGGLSQCDKEVVILCGVFYGRPLTEKKILRFGVGNLSLLIFCIRILSVSVAQTFLHERYDPVSEAGLNRRTKIVWNEDFQGIFIAWFN